MPFEDNPTSLPDAGNGSREIEPINATPAPPHSGEAINLFASIDKLSPVASGDIVQGRVVKITHAEVLVDIGLKGEAVVPRAEFLKDSGELAVDPGETVDLWIERYDEITGTVSASRRKAVRLKVWEEIERAFREQTTMRGRVVDRIKGGLTVDIGIPAFLPGSHADVRPHSNLEALKGQEITCKVVKVNRSRSNAVVSRKLALEEEAKRRKTELLERLVEGAELVGRIKNLTDYGVFVDLGGIDGLLHITDLSWRRVMHPSEVVQVGQEIKVKVLKFDPQKERVSLGLKQQSPDPWERVHQTYHPGDRVKGRVVSVADYGAFIELEPGVEGLLHISEMSWSRRSRHPSKIVKVDDDVDVVVLDISRAQRRISLSLKQALPDPWAELAKRLTPGSVMEGRVRSLTEFGAFVEVEDGVDGLIHLSNLSWAANVKHPSEILKKGQKVQAVVLSVDATKRRLSLGLKQLQPDLWQSYCSKIRVGEIVRGKVSRLVTFGAFVELAEGIEGLCHVSEYGEPAGGSSRFEVGRQLDFRVIRLAPEARRIGLSLKFDPEIVKPGGNIQESQAKTMVAMVEPPSSLTVVQAKN